MGCIAMLCSDGVRRWLSLRGWTPPVSQLDKDIAAETHSNVGDFPNAILNGPAGTQDECSVTVRADGGGGDDADRERRQDNG